MPDLLKLVKDGQEITADRSQLAVLKADGWREPADELGSYKLTEGAEHGGEQHAGGSLDPEHGSGEDRQEPGNYPVGVE